MGPNSGLHIIIFDEIDAICKARGSQAGSTGKNCLSFYISISLTIYLSNEIDAICKTRVSQAESTSRNSYLSNYLPI